MLGQLALGLLFGAAVGWASHRLGALTRGGIVVEAAVSGLVFLAGGWVWGALPLVYLASSAYLVRYHEPAKVSTSGHFRRRAMLDSTHLLGKVAWAAVLAMVFRLGPQSQGMFPAFVGALAAANADTWAAELGILSTRPARLITTGQPARPGEPGGVTALGFMAALGGAWLMGLLGMLAAVLAAVLEGLSWPQALAWLPLAAAAGGIVGMLVDSLLGATAQATFFCERCRQQTELRVHQCGETTRQVRGWPWLSNDGVNLVATIVGAAVAAGFYEWLAQFGT
ncbi:MAG: DUF92 domain-containing protein [Anaerolineae bacterium]